MRKSFFATSLALAALLIAGVSPAAAANTVTVSPDDMQGWSFFDDNTNGPGTGQMVVGPARPPLGIGSAQLSLTGPADRQALGTLAYSGTRVADITTLTYFTHQMTTQAIPFQFDVNYLSGTAYQGRLVFEPGNGNPTGSAGAWKKFDAKAGKWWLSRGTPLNLECHQNNPCTLARFVEKYPTSTIRGRVLFKAGGGWTLPYRGNVDAFTIGVNSKSTTFDFEPTQNDNNCGQGGGNSNESGNNNRNCD